MVVIDMEILQSPDETGGKIGNPTPYNTNGTFNMHMHEVRNSKKAASAGPYGVCLTCR